MAVREGKCKRTNARAPLAPWSLLHAVALGALALSLCACGSKTQTASEAATVRELALALRSPSEQQRLDAASRLKEMRYRAGDALPALSAALRDRSPLVRVVAAGALGNLGPQAASPLALALNSDAEEKVRAAAASAIGALGPKEAPSGLAALAHALDDDSELVRARAAAALDRFGPPARTHLDRAARDESPIVRDAARTGVSRLEKRLAGARDADPAEVAALTRTLREGKGHQRLIAAQDLGMLGKRAAGALPDLLAAAQDKDHAVRVAALGALRSFGAAPMPAYIAGLADRHSAVRNVAAEGLGRLGAEASSAVPDLAARLTDPEMAVRLTCVEALARIGGAEAASALRTATKDRDWFVRERAAKALAKLEASRADAE